MARFWDRHDRNGPFPNCAAVRAVREEYCYTYAQMPEMAKKYDMYIITMRKLLKHETYPFCGGPTQKLRRRHKGRLTYGQVCYIRLTWPHKYGSKELAERFGVHHSTIRKAGSGETYPWITLIPPVERPSRLTPEDVQAMTEEYLTDPTATFASIGKKYGVTASTVSRRTALGK